MLFQEAPKLQVDDSLPALVSAAEGRCLPYVALEGKDNPVALQEGQGPGSPLLAVTHPLSLGIVLPAQAALTSHYHEGLQGVIQKLQLKEHRLIWNSLARGW